MTLNEMYATYPVLWVPTLGSVYAIVVLWIWAARGRWSNSMTNAVIGLVLNTLYVGALLSLTSSVGWSWQFVLLAFWFVYGYGANLFVAFGGKIKDMSFGFGEAFFSTILTFSVMLLWIFGI